VLQRQNQAAYWTTGFKVTRADIEYLFSQFLEDETPLTTRDLAVRLIQHRIAQEEDKLRKQIARGQLFQPKGSYEVGQELIFPVFDYGVGKVVGQRSVLRSSRSNSKIRSGESLPHSFRSRTA
jgi:hypothetical protein